MISKVYSAAVIGLDAQLVQVEVHFTTAKRKFYIVGLPDKACSESKERVSAIVGNYLGKMTPAGVYTVNLSPADIPKSGPVYDLPIAIGMLQSLSHLSYDPKDNLIIGELSLDGQTRYTHAILPIADLARKKGIKNIYLPYSNVNEASAIPGINIYPVKNLTQLVTHFDGGEKIEKFKSNEAPEINEGNEQYQPNDLIYIKGQEYAKRALEIAAAGGHNLLMTGSPGSGKSMLAKALPTILPQLSTEESLEVTKIYSVSNLLSSNQGLIKVRPFRKPHHTISHVALVGGGSIPKPGEISLAHRGVLFLDEFTEFSSQTLEALRQPLEDGVITISRAKQTLEFPAKLMLIAAMNPCRCGWYGDEKRECRCTQLEREKYERKISGPLLDRIDMQIYVKRVEYEKLKMSPPHAKGSPSSGGKAGQPLAGHVTCHMSHFIQQKVQDARNVQEQRFVSSKIIINSEMTQKDIEKYIHLNKKSQVILKKAVESLDLSARSYFRILRVSRTIADLEQSDSVKSNHVTEALSYRLN